MSVFLIFQNYYFINFCILNDNALLNQFFGQFGLATYWIDKGFLSIELVVIIAHNSDFLICQM